MRKEGCLHTLLSSPPLNIMSCRVFGVVLDFQEFHISKTIPVGAIQTAQGGLLG